MRAIFFSLISMFFLVQHASAATVSFTGAVASSGTSEFAVGDVMTGSFEIDADTVEWEGSDFKRFLISTATVSIGSSFSAATIGSRSTIFDVYNATSFDGYAGAIYVPFNNGVSGTSLLPTTFSISLQTQNTATLDSTDFPSAIDVADFSSKRWSISFDDDGQRVDVSGNLTSVEISAVPLPAGLPMLIAGLCAFGLVRRRL